MTPLKQLRRIRRGVRATLVLGVVVSVAGNVLHAHDNPISQAIAAWPPLALLITVELIARVPVHRRSLAAARLLATAAIAGIAAWVSYWHMAGVAARYGETGASPYLMPLSVDGLVVVASICLVELAGRIRGAEAGPVRELAQPEPAAPVRPVFDHAKPIGPMPAPAPRADRASAGAPGPDDAAGQRVRQDPRTAQQIETVVRALRLADARLSQRQIAVAAMTSPTNVRRILGPARAGAEAPESKPVNGHPVLEDAPA